MSDQPAEVRYLFIRRPVLAADRRDHAARRFAMTAAVNAQITPPSIQGGHLAPAPARRLSRRYRRSSNNSRDWTGLLTTSANSNSGEHHLGVLTSARPWIWPRSTYRTRRRRAPLPRGANPWVIVRDQPQHPDAGGTRPTTPATTAFLSNYAKLYVEDEVKRIPGVGNAQTFGGSEFSMLIS